MSRVGEDAVSSLWKRHSSSDTGDLTKDLVVARETPSESSEADSTDSSTAEEEDEDGWESGNYLLFVYLNA